MNKRQYLITAILIVIATALWVALSGPSKDSLNDILIAPLYGNFKVSVTVTGELQAENSVKILGPSGLRSIRIYNVKITDLIPEGSIVDSGAYVATLDRTEAATRLRDVAGELEKKIAQYTATQLDTTLDLRGLRDNLVNLRYSKEETKLRLDQSKFEPPAVIRQAEIDLEKANRAYTQAIENYDLKQKQSAAKMREAEINLAKQQRSKNNIDTVMKQFVVMAPKSGMLIYHREWSGSKRKVGSMLSSWEPVVATLPDLSSMVSETYINEIDISKIKEGQHVTVGVDAFPGKEFMAQVMQVANIGEQLPNTEAKVFKVLIKLHESDSVLRPSMTTSNEILVSQQDRILSIPIECLHITDSLSFVFIKAGMKTIKQEVRTGNVNEMFVEVMGGIKKSDQIFLSSPKDGDEILVTLIDTNK